MDRVGYNGSLTSVVNKADKTLQLLTSDERSSSEESSEKANKRWTLVEFGYFKF